MIDDNQSQIIFNDENTNQVSNDLINENKNDDINIDNLN